MAGVFTPSQDSTYVAKAGFTEKAETLGQLINDVAEAMYVADAAIKTMGGAALSGTAANEALANYRLNRQQISELVMDFAAIDDHLDKYGEDVAAKDLANASNLDSEIQTIAYV